MIDFLNQILDYQFLHRALITSIVVGIACGTVGSLVILRGLSLMGDAMSHAVPTVVSRYFLYLTYLPFFIWVTMYFRYA